MNKYEQILTKYWGYKKFRPLQEDIIVAVAEEKKDALALLPTGGGKSIIFQVAGLSLEGITLVITPLIALMNDQVANLQKRKISAVAIHSGLKKDEIKYALNRCIYSDVKFLYLSPERISSPVFISRLPYLKVALIAVDEAHCISQWGYDFRPSYLQIADLRENIEYPVPFLALTATATNEVVTDIQDKLQFQEKNVYRKSFQRENIIYIVRKVDDKLEYLLKTVSRQRECGIIYVRNRKKTREIAIRLNQKGINADFYHAGLTTEARELKQKQWTEGSMQIMVATNAFGMGIDKSNVRFVVHFGLPNSIEAYFQEAGRAGRDEKPAYAALIFSNLDITNAYKSVDVNFPERNYIKNTYNALGNFYQLPIGSGKGMVFDFNLLDFSSRYKFHALTAYNAIKYLQYESYLELTDKVTTPSRIKFIVSREDLYRFQVSNAKYDFFIKLLLRNYTGVFGDYVKINEKHLARITKSSFDVVYQYLIRLSSSKIINYIPSKRTALLIFTEERLSNQSLQLPKANYDERKKRYSQQIEAMIQYATGTAKCRSLSLIAYFGEDNVRRCGTCDVCRRRNKLGLSKYEFDIILKEIKLLLRSQTLSISEIYEVVKYDKEKIDKVIGWLKENKKIETTESDLLRWCT